jgi:hypothetical protein
MNERCSPYNLTPTFIYPDGTLFNGYFEIIMVLPSNSGAQWTQASLRGSNPRLVVPQRYKIPIVEGKVDIRTRLWQTIALVPSHIVYAIFIYDSVDRLMHSYPALYSATTDPIFSLSGTFIVDFDPTPGVTVPSPDSVPSSNVVTLTYNTPVRASLSGVKDGINRTFTIPQPGSVVLVIWNDLVLQPSVQYTISGTTITMGAFYIPRSGDTLECLIWP